MLKHKMWLLVTLLFFGFLINQPSINKIFGASSTITMNLTETPQAFKNPLKGFRPSRYIGDSSFKDYEYTSTYKHYIAYTALEYDASDSVQKIIDYCNSVWAGIETKNLKVIPRVVIFYPGTGEYWGDIPHDGTPAQWTTDALKNRLMAMASKLAQAWDNDPRVAAVELGLWGKWGEHNIYPDTTNLPPNNDRIPAAFQRALGDAFTQSFKNKKVMVRYPETFTNYNFGYIWDSFALPNDAACGDGIIARNCWQNQMISGEVAYDWGDQSQLGGSPNGTLNSNSNTDYVISWIQKTHASSLGWVAEYTTNGTDNVEYNATRMQKAFGYRFVINQATFSSRADQGGTLSLSFKVTNVGNAPFYYNWPVQVSFLNPNRSVAWSATFNTDIRQWLPGSSYTVSGTFNIPNNLTSGTYTLALAVLDPAGNQPSLRFANTNYYAGGRTPIGKIGVGQDPSDQNLGSFDDLKNDHTLSYSLNNGPIPTPTPSNTPVVTPTPTSTTFPSPTPTPNSGNLILDNCDGIPVWPGGNDLGNWAGANSFINNAGVINDNALVLPYNNAGWFGSDVNRDISRYQYLVFRMKGAAGGEQNAFKLRIGNAYKMFSEFTSTPITTSYQDIRIDMIASGINRSSPGQLSMEFWYGKNGTIYIDEIRFE